MRIFDSDSQQILDGNEAMLRLLNCSQEDFFAVSSDELSNTGSFGLVNGENVWSNLQRDGSVVRLINCRMCDRQEDRSKFNSTLAADSSGSRLG